MPDAKTLINEIKNETFDENEGYKHDVARMEYREPMPLVKTYEEFSWLIGDYLNHHNSICNSTGLRLPEYKARSLAKEILNQAYQRRGGNIDSAFKDACERANGGVRYILDVLADELKAKAMELYIRDAFDRNVAPNSWSQKVEIVAQFMRLNYHLISSKIREQPPEQYAHNYEELIRSFINGVQQASNVFRRF